MDDGRDDFSHKLSNVDCVHCRHDGYCFVRWLGELNGREEGFCSHARDRENG